MFEDAIGKNKGAIFPIGLGKDQGSSITFNVCGTGFFINDEGYFVSATHLFDADPSAEYFKLDLRGKELAWEKIRVISQDKPADLLIGKVDSGTAEFFAFSLNSPVGRSVCIAGYTFGQLQSPYYQPTMIIDNNVHVQINSNEISRSYEGILLSDPGISGLSGGPVFDKFGSVHGMQVLNNTRKAQNLIVHNALATRSEIIQKHLLEAGVNFTQKSRSQKEIK